MIRTVPLSDLPIQLRECKKPPPQLYVMSEAESDFETLMSRPRIAIVGTRRISEYGLAVGKQLAGELAARGVVIVSGLAFGVDATAHEATLAANGTTIAVLPSPVEDVMPRSHANLARRIMQSGGALVSSYPEGTEVRKHNFVERNKIVAGLATALVVVEAAENSGTFHTVEYAKEQGIDVLAVPGNITSPTSTGTNRLIKEGSTPITCTQDVLHYLHLPGIKPDEAPTLRPRGENKEEQLLLDLMEQGISAASQLLHASGLGIEKFNHHLTMLEISAKIRSLGANNWTLA